LPDLLGGERDLAPRVRRVTCHPGREGEREREREREREKYH
jgi:hypothetical protein